MPPRSSWLALTACISVCACHASVDYSGDAGDGSREAAPSSALSGGATECEGSTNIEQTVCAANAFLATLSDAERASTYYEYSDSASRTKWSNTPTDYAERAGTPLGSLSRAAQDAGFALFKVVLSDAGYLDLEVVRAADNLLAAQNLTNRYGADWYYVSIFGAPSTTDAWALMLTGHHYTVTITYSGGVAYPFPYQMGIEPKDALQQDIGTYEPMADEVDTLLDAFLSLSETQMASAYLDGQSFADMLVGPVEYATGSDDKARSTFPTGANRTGLLVSEMNERQKLQVTHAIRAWVGDFNSEVSEHLMEAYTSEAAFADTYIAFAGPSATSIDVKVKGTYLRIDGPRVWIEIVSHDNLPILRPVHFHCICRDKLLDYGGTLYQLDDGDPLQHL